MSCVRMRVHVRLLVRVRVRVCPYVFVCVRVGPYVFACVRMCSRVSVCVSVCVCPYVSACVRMCSRPKARMCLSTYLVHLFQAALLSTMSEHLTAEVFIRTRSGGELFQLARLKASTNTRELCIRELLYADDAAIVAHTLEDTREICKPFEQAANLFGLTTNTPKTDTLNNLHPDKPQSIHMFKSTACH